MIQSMKAAAMATAAITALAFAGGAAAAADANAGLQAMQELNIIVFGDMSAGHDIEGKTFVGGTLTGSSPFGIGNSTQGALPSGWPTLTVVGNTAGGNINNGSNGGNGLVATAPGIAVGGNASGFNFNTQNATVKVGGFLSGTNGSAGSTFEVGGTVSGVNANGATINSNLGSGFTTTLVDALTGERTTLYDNLTALSAALAGLATTTGSGLDTADFNNVKLNAVAGGDGFAVLNLSAADLTSAHGLTYNFTPGLATIINVTGNVNSGDWAFNTLGNGSAFNQDVLFNFVDATTVDFGTIIHGSVLAPFATVYNHTPIEGTLVAQNFVQGGEVHLGTFGGGVDLTPPGGTVPEPATWAMLVVGFGLVGIGARRHRRNHRVAA